MKIMIMKVVGRHFVVSQVKYLKIMMKISGFLIFFHKNHILYTKSVYGQYKARFAIRKALFYYQFQ